MHFVNNIDTVFCNCRCKACFFPQHTDTVNAIITGGVNLDNIHHAAVPYPPANLTLTAGIAVLEIQTVYGICQNLGTCRLSGTTASRKEISMRNSAGCQLILQRLCDLRLANDIRKSSGPPFAVKHLIHRTDLPSGSIIFLAENSVSKMLKTG